MAVTYAVSGLVRSVAGDKRAHYATLTAGGGGTYTTDGDSVLASALALSALDSVSLEALQTTGATATAFQARAVISSDKKSFLVRLHANNAAPGPTVIDPQAAAAQNVAGLTLTLTAIGR